MFCLFVITNFAGRVRDRDLDLDRTLSCCHVSDPVGKVSKGQCIFSVNVKRVENGGTQERQQTSAFLHPCVFCMLCVYCGLPTILYPHLTKHFLSKVIAN